MASLPCLQVLERTRPAIIFAAIVSHKPTVMSNIEWKFEPWKAHPERIDSMKLLFDIIVDCPQLYVLRDRILSHTDDEMTRAAMQELVTECHQVMENLEQWGRDFACSPSHAPTEFPAPSTTPIVEDERGSFAPAWSTVNRYESLYHANAMAVYHGALIMVSRVLDSIGVDSLYDHNTRQARMLAAAMFICRSVDYHQEGRWGEQGNFDLLFPLRMAYDVIGTKEHAIGTWICGLLDDMSAGRRGLLKSAKSLLYIGDKDVSKNALIEQDDDYGI